MPTYDLSPTDIENSARQKYNAVGDTFFPSANIYNWIYEAEMILASKAEVIEQIYSSTTVANQASYAYPTNTIVIKRLTVNGRKMKRITHRQDDAVTLQNSASAQSGAPSYYTDFNFTISLRPIPDGAYTLQIYSLNLPSAVTATSTLDVPAMYHMDIVDYVLSEMFAQDQNTPMAQYHLAKWEKHVMDAISFQKKRKRGDSFSTVMSEDILPVTILGEI